MATASVDLAYHGTLVIDTADTITMTRPYRTVRVVNRGTSGDLFVRTDGTAAVESADDNWVVPAATYQDIPVRYAPNEPANSVANQPQISVICHTTNAYSVVGI